MGVVVCRTGYTGERGYELIAANDVAVRCGTPCSRPASDFGMLPCGLGARDTLRTEMGYPLHGQDISLDVTPNEGRLGWAVGWDKHAFWGRDVLLREKEEGPERILRGIVATGPGHPAPRHGRQPHPRRDGRRGHLAAPSRRRSRRASGSPSSPRRSPPTPRSASTSAVAARSSRSPSRRSSSPERTRES